MERVMERRNLVAGLIVLALSLFMLTGTALARTAHHSKHATTKSTTPTTEECVVKSEPGAFMDTGESVLGAPNRASSVADIIEVECLEEYAGSTVKVADQELWARCKNAEKEHLMSWTVPPATPAEFGDTSPEAEATLDNDGNATFVVWGTNCAAGETLVTADLEAGKHPTVTTTFTVTPPRPTPESIQVYPAVEGATNGEGAAMDNDVNSSTAAIVYLEFSPEFAEEFVNVNDRQLFAKCKLGNKVVWIGPNEEELATGPEAGVETVQLDNDGNAFVVAIAGESCQAGKTLVEASLEAAPYTTLYTTLTVLPPEPTI
jgi:uncharacterized lipoprotein YajG